MRECENCAKPFDPHSRASPSAREGGIAQMKYCSMRCKRHANNKRYYERNKLKVKVKVLVYQNKDRAAYNARRRELYAAKKRGLA